MKPKQSHKGLVIRPFRIILMYVTISAIWILSSDYVLSLFVRNTDQIVHLQMLKGGLFIILSALVLFYLIRKYSQTISSQLISLDKANKDLELFIYKASHDLRGPIASMMGLSEVALNEVQDAESIIYLKKIHHKSIKLDGLLRELVAFINLRDSEIQSSSLSLNMAVEDVMTRLSCMPGFEKVKINTTVNQHSDFYGDAHILKTVMEKLLDNAYHYSQPVEEPEVNINVNLQKHLLSLEVIDNGIGIPKQSLPQVFNMFYRASMLSTGNGLGLFIVRNLVEKLGGTVSIMSEENKGTKVSVKIPVYHRQEHNSLSELTSSYLQEA